MTKDSLLDFTVLYGWTSSNSCVSTILTSFVDSIFHLAIEMFVQRVCMAGTAVKQNI